MSIGSQEQFTSALTVLEAVEALGSQRKKKIEMLNQHVDNEALQTFFRRAYDWKTTFGMRARFHVANASVPNNRSVPLFGAAAKSSTIPPWVAFNALLDQLERRELTGNAAKSAWELLFLRLDERERVWFSRLLNKDLKVGIDRTSIAEVWPDLIEPFGCQLAKDFDPDENLLDGETKKKLDPWIRWPVVVETKLDGMRVLIDYDSETKACVAHSREGHHLPHIQPFLDELAAHLAALEAPTCRIDSEAFADAGGWNASLSYVKKEEVDLEERRKLRFYCFDFLLDVPADARPLDERRITLKKYIGKATNPPPQFTVLKQKTATNLDELMEIYAEAVDGGNEGVMLKFAAAPYSAKRNRNWLKLKPTKTVDAEIVAVEAGKQGGKHEHRMGWFVVRRGDNGKTCKVGGGFSDAQRDEIWQNRDSYVGKIIEFREQDARGDVAKVNFPRFVRFREDRERV